MSKRPPPMERPKVELWRSSRGAAAERVRRPARAVRRVEAYMFSKFGWERVR